MMLEQVWASPQQRYAFGFDQAPDMIRPLTLGVVRSSRSSSIPCTLLSRTLNSSVSSIRASSATSISPCSIKVASFLRLAVPLHKIGPEWDVLGWLAPGTVVVPEKLAFKIIR